MIVLTLLMSLLLETDSSPTTIQDITVKHRVKSGESLHSITKDYLGTDILWQENWKLNPEIDNPHMLSIGQELTVIKERIIPAEKARVLDVANRVEKKPTTSDWRTTHVGDELVQQEGVRTFENSSTLLAFNDDSKLKVLEYSQIFLKRRETNLRGTDSATIEIIKGDTELNWEPLGNQAADITFIMGSTSSKPTINKGQVTALRTGITDVGNSVISVYQGHSAVESAGSEVQVKQGMGVAVKQGQAPPPPEKLLRAPKVDTLANNSFKYTNPIVTWSAVNNAADYVFELCADAQCDVVLGEAKTTDLSRQISQIKQAGTYYFRVAARSDQQLVGYRSKTTEILVTGDHPDTQAPLVALEMVGDHKIDDQGHLISPRTQLQIHAMDELSGLAELKYRWDQGSWISHEPESLIPTATGVLEVEASDVLGHVANHQYRFEGLEPKQP